MAGDLLRLALFGGRVGKQAMGRVEPVVAVLAHAVGSEQAGEGVKVIRVSLNHLLKGVNGGRRLEAAEGLPAALQDLLILRVWHDDLDVLSRFCRAHDLHQQDAAAQSQHAGGQVGRGGLALPGLQGEQGQRNDRQGGGGQGDRGPCPAGHRKG